MSYSRITAFLGLDITNFQSGLDKANGLLARFKAMAKIGGAGGLGGLLGAGAIVQSFRAVLERAQQARDAARELGRTVDEGTASVARYADQWDRIKAAIGDIAIGTLSLFTKAGSAIGDYINTNMDRTREFFGGQSAAESRRIREIDVGAEANADRLSSPAALAAAKARGDAKRSAAAKADEQSMREVASLMNDAADRRERTALEALPLAQQITELERRKLYFQKEYANTSRPALARARALNDLAKTEEDITRKKSEQEKEVTAEKKRQTEAQQRNNEKAAEALETYERALTRESAAGRGLSAARRDALGFTVADAASGTRGNTFAGEAARGILRDEARARSLADSGRKVTLFDAKTQTNRQVGAEYYQQRALAAREALPGLTSGEKNPFAAADQELKAAGAELKSAAEALKNAVIIVEVADEES